VTQIARALARALGLDEDLAEATALGHDLGHPPFGHAGERALDGSLRNHGGFDHNAQTLAVVTRLERRYAAFDGLNLTWATVEGLVKHNGPLTDRQGRPLRSRALPGEVADYDRQCDLALWSYPSAEAQVAAIADDIAYDAHDIDDGVRADLFALDEMGHLPLAGELLGEIDALRRPIDRTRRIHELVRRMITRMIDDVIAETGRRIAQFEPRSVEEVRQASVPMVGFSADMARADHAIKQFLLPRVYRQTRVARVMRDAEMVVGNLFGHYASNPDDLPPEWAEGIDPADTDTLARRAADYIAGMTDPFALAEHRRFFPRTPELR
jgi:dGTPase